jgi:radical SAM protein with 4Fe4S-binding SPASM domain
MLYDTKSEQKMLLNDIGTQIFLSKFVKYVTDEEIAKSLHSQFKEQNYEDLLNDVVSVLNDIYNSGFVTNDCDQRGFINLIETEWQMDSLIFEVTKKCNLKCLHCMEGGSKESEELTTKQIFDLIDELHYLKTYRIVLTGGEPFVRDDIREIIEKCTEKNIKTTVFTNGTLITEKLLNQIKDLNVLLRFSIEGADASTHDKIRGEGNFDRTISIIKLCTKMGIDIGISATITTHNFEQYFKMLDLAIELGSKETELSEIKDKGNASCNRELLLSQKQMEQLRVNSVMSAAQRPSFSKGMGYDRLYEISQEDKKREYCCAAGISNCFISADGSVYPCMLFKEFKEFEAGNITEKKFADIWESSEAFNKMRNLKITDIKSCVECECFEACPGGCRAVAYAETKTLDGQMDKVFCDTSINLTRRRDAGEFDDILKSSKSL